MKLVLKTNNYGFHIEISNYLWVNSAKEVFPLDSYVVVLPGRICFPVLGIRVGIEDRAIMVKEGDVIWSIKEEFICICLSEKPPCLEDKEFKGVKIGRTLASIGELQQLKADTKVSISLLEEKKNPDNRILSQKEIDDLVKQLLQGR